MSNTTLESRVYAPYTSKKAYCYVESTCGKLFPGVRIENISFPLTIEAEQCAIYICISEGFEPEKLWTVYSEVEHNGEPYWARVRNLEIAQIPYTEEEIQEKLHQPKLYPSYPKSDAEAAPFYRTDIVEASNFPVLSFIEVEGGWVTGHNIEEEIYQAGLCAERVAFAKVVAYGLKVKNKLWANAKKQNNLTTPCGACRQVMWELAPNLEILLPFEDTKRQKFTIEELLPEAFKTSFD